MIADPPLPPPPAPQEVETHLQRDSRCVHDTAALCLFDYMENKAAFFVIVTLTPGPMSGSATVPGAFINGATGQTVIPANAQAVVVKEGKWKCLALKVAE